MKNLLLILGFPIWFPLLIAVAAVLFSLYCVLLVLVICLFVVFVSLIACGIFAGLGTGIYFAIIGSPVTGIALIGCGIMCLGLSIFFLFGAKGLFALAKNIVIAVKNRLARGKA